MFYLFLGIYPEDRVIFIGTSRSPWEAEQKLLFQCYQKVIQIPRADYGSISLMWRTVLHKAGALSPRLDVSSLSRVSDSYTIGIFWNLYILCCGDCVVMNRVFIHWNWIKFDCSWTQLLNASAKWRLAEESIKENLLPTSAHWWGMSLTLPPVSASVLQSQSVLKATTEWKIPGYIQAHTSGLRRISLYSFGYGCLPLRCP